jgi:hypothetical protein
MGDDVMLNIMSLRSLTSLDLTSELLTDQDIMALLILSNLEALKAFAIIPSVRVPIEDFPFLLDQGGDVSHWKCPWRNLELSVRISPEQLTFLHIEPSEINIEYK